MEYSILFALIPICAYFGYKLFRGKMNKAALIVSIVGVATAGKRGRKGKALGLIGIGLPVAYLVVIIALVVGYNAMSFSKNLATGQSDLYRMGHKGIGTVLNTEYDVSKYRLRESDLESLNISVSDDELEDYSLNKLTSITTSCHDSYEGRYKKYDFLIIKGEDFEDWLDKQPVGYISYTRYYEDEYICISYPATLEFEGSTICTLDVYKDPSDKFIIITNCGDFKVITEFFESS